MSLKAEVFSSDFIIGMFLFLIAIVLFEIFYANLHSDINDYKIRDDIQAKTNSIADVLVTSTGEPEYWSSSNVKVIGFFNSGLINLTKFDELKLLGYYNAKKMMGAENYEIYIEITNETGNIINGYTYGIKEGENSEQVIYVKRLGLVNYNDNVTKAILNVGVWI